MKKCSYCGKEYPDDALECPVDKSPLELCQTEPATPGAAPSKAEKPPARKRLTLYFVWGLLFEAVLIALAFLLPESWLQVEVRNFVIITHYPVMMLTGFVADTLHIGGDVVSGTFLFLVGLATMGASWGFLIYLVTRSIKGVTGRLSPRQKMVFKWGFSLLCVAMLLWAVVSAIPATPIHFTPSPQVRSTVDGNTAFALDLYQKLKDQPGNLFFSPYSISASLAMTYAGARGQTETEMAKALHFNPGQTNLPAAFGELTAHMDRLQRWNRITLAIANSLWCQKDHSFSQPFLKVARDFYRAEVRPIDFRSPKAAADEINAWVERRTKGKIQNAVNSGQFDLYTRLVLCDAIYFKGKWQHQFVASVTHPAPFHVTTNQTVTVPMMYQKEHFKMAIADDGSVELLELPYSGTDLSMIILLPQRYYASNGFENPDLYDLEHNLTADNLWTWLAKLDGSTPHETSVELPRFTTAQSFDLVKQLKSLGIVSAFDMSADFSGMDGTTNLFIADVFHKSFVEVNESGTEAAAVSIQMVATQGMGNRFIADHPFIFLIRDNGSGSILFIGRIVDPTK